MSDSMNIWSFLHSLPHINHGFSKVSNTFILPSTFDELWKWNTNNYQKSIQMFAIIPILLGIIYLISCIVISCLCNKSKNKNNNSIDSSIDNNNPNIQDGNNNAIIPAPSGLSGPIGPGAIDSPPLLHDYQSPVDSNNVIERRERLLRYQESKKQSLTPFAMYLRFFIALFILLSIGISVYYGYLLNNTITDIEDLWEDTNQPYDTALHFSYKIESIIESSINECNSMKKDTTCSDIKPYINTVENQLNKSYNYVQNYRSVAQTVTWGDSGDIENYRKFGVFTGIGVLSFCALLLLISLCTKARTTSNKIVCNIIIRVLLGFGMFLIWIIASIQFGFSVEVSDVCNNPNNAVLQAVNISTNPTPDTWSIVKYYIYCDNKHSYNPLINQTQAAYNELILINSDISTLVNESSQCGVHNEASDLNTSYTQMLINLVDLNESLKCNQINSYYLDIQHDTCFKMLNEWFILYCLQYGIVLLLIIRSLFVCTIGDKQENNNTVFNNKNSMNDPNASLHHPRQEYGRLASDASAVDQPRYGMMSDDVVLEDTPQARKPTYERVITQPPPSDAEFRKCLKFLYSFENWDERTRKGEMLKEVGYPGTVDPLSSELVDRSMAILRNAERNKDSKYKHRLLDGIV